MNGSNLAVDTGTNGNYLEPLARAKGQDVRKNPAYRSSRYIRPSYASGERQWHISITHTDSLYDEACGQPYVPETPENKSANGETTAELTTEDAFALSLQQFMQGSHLDMEEDIWDIEARLIPPPMPQRRIKVKFRFIGKETPRISFNPERD
jgi:hypothetical protein